jgi:hypothetical protein
MQAPKLHAGEIDISTNLAVELIADQFPQWAGLPIRPVASAGTECVLYRLGEDLVIRLPRRPDESLDSLLTGGVLAKLAPFLPVLVPELMAQGQPTADYPASWGVLHWIEGDTPVEGRLTAPDLLAGDLADSSWPCGGSTCHTLVLQTARPPTAAARSPKNMSSPLAPSSGYAVRSTPTRPGLSGTARCSCPTGKAPLPSSTPT